MPKFPQSNRHIVTLPGSKKLGDRTFAPPTEHVDFAGLAALEATSFLSEVPAMRERPLEVIEGCQAAIGTLENVGRQRLYELLALGYGFAHLIYKDEDLKHEFLAKPFWQHRKYDVKSEPLQLVMQFCLNAENGTAGYRRACTYSRALLVPFIAGVPMEEIADFIVEHGGIDKLASPQPKNWPVEPDGPDFDNLVEDYSDAVPDDADEESTTVDHDDASETAMAGVGPSFPEVNLAHDLVVRASEHLADVLSAPSGHLARITVRIGGEPGEYRELRAVRVNVFEGMRKR